MQQQADKFIPQWEDGTRKSRVIDVLHRSITKLEYGPMPNVMAALPNIGGALCSIPQSLADAHCWSTVQ